MIWGFVLFMLLFTAAITAGLWGPCLQDRWAQHRDREKNAAGDALADVAIALMRDDPASWRNDGELYNDRTGMRIYDNYGYGASLCAGGIPIPISPKAKKALLRARKEWADRKEQERVRQALATVGGKLHVINGGRHG